MHGARYMWITVLPLAWLVAVTFTAGIEKIFSSEPRLGFLAHASALDRSIAAGQIAASSLSQTRAVIFNERLDAVLCGVFLALVAVILLDSIRTWYALLHGTKSSVTSETPFIRSQLGVEAL